MATSTDTRVILVSLRDQVSAGLKQISTQLGNAHKQQAAFGNALKAGRQLMMDYVLPITAAIAGMKQLGAAVSAMMQDFYEAERANTRVAGVLRATGKAATLSAAGVQRMADTIAATTTFTDEAAKEAAALALTFNAVTKESLPRLLALSADFAALYGGDMADAMQTIGIAMDDVEGGMTQLRKVGVVLSDETENYIKSLVAQGREVEAQNLLLDEMEGKVKGLAATMNDTAWGAAENFKKALHDIGEVLGGLLAEFARPLTGTGTSLMQNLLGGFGTFTAGKQAERLTFEQAKGMTGDDLAKLADTAALLAVRAMDASKQLFPGMTDMAMMFGTKGFDPKYWGELAQRIATWASAAFAQEERAAQQKAAAAPAINPKTQNEFSKWLESFLASQKGPETQAFEAYLEGMKWLGEVAAGKVQGATAEEMGAYVDILLAGFEEIRRDADDAAALAIMDAVVAAGERLNAEQEFQNTIWQMDQKVRDVRAEKLMQDELYTHRKVAEIAQKELDLHMKEWEENHQKRTQEALQTASGLMSGGLEGVLNNLLTTAMNTTVKGTVDFGLGVFESMGVFFNEVAVMLPGLLESLVAAGPVVLLVMAVMEIIQGIVEVLGPTVEAVLKPVHELLKLIGNALGTLFVPVLEAMAPLIKAVCELLGGILVPIFQVLAPVFKVLAIVLKAFLMIPMGIIFAIVTILNGVIDAINRITPDWIGDLTRLPVPDMTFDIPEFHSGGVAQNETLALLRKDEEVLSPGESERYRTWGGGVTVVAPNARYLDATLAADLVKLGLSEMRR